MKITSYIFLSLLLAVGCANGEQPTGNGAFSGKVSQNVSHYDFDQIQSAGELIVVTMSGPNSYYEYQGRRLGLQYALISHFAQSNGLRVRVELAHNEKELVKVLKRQEADIICYPLADSLIAARQLVGAGMRDDSLHTSWAVRRDCPLLQEVLDAWYGKGIIVTVEKSVDNDIQHRHQVKKTGLAPYQSKERGIISPYDEYLKSAAMVVGWDWRLLAAQCYQESGFDASAVSWAGARGLMQIMPSTAAHLKLPMQQIFNPRENVAAAASYLKELDGLLGDIKDLGERQKFVLAAYNGGLGHIQDARALTRKHGKNAKLWSDVATSVRLLSDERYYRDEVVKHGYMVGEETVGYVNSILDRWHTYCKSIAPVSAGEGIKRNLKGVPVKKNRFTT